jgi:hypothetical protein
MLAALNQVSPPDVPLPLAFVPPAPPVPAWYVTVPPGVSDKLVILEYAPPPPPAPATLLPPDTLPPPPPPMTSMVLSALFQSEGTVQLVPEVRKMTAVPGLAFARGVARTNMPAQMERAATSAIGTRRRDTAARILRVVLAEDFW